MHKLTKLFINQCSKEMDNILSYRHHISGKIQTFFSIHINTTRKVYLQFIPKF